MNIEKICLILNYFTKKILKIPPEDPNVEVLFVFPNKPPPVFVLFPNNPPELLLFPVSKQNKNTIGS